MFNTGGLVDRYRPLRAVRRGWRLIRSIMVLLLPSFFLRRLEGSIFRANVLLAVKYVIENQFLPEVRGVILRFPGRYKKLICNEIFRKINESPECMGADNSPFDEKYIQLWCDALAESAINGSALLLVEKLHDAIWDFPNSAMRKITSDLLERMLEHRLFNEQESGLHKKLGEAVCLTDENLKLYVSCLFSENGLGGEIWHQLHGDAGSMSQSPEDSTKNPSEEKSAADSHIKNLHLFYAYRHLTLHTYHVGAGRYIPRLADLTYETQRKLRKRLPRISKRLESLLNEKCNCDIADIRLMSSDWTSLIGHNGHLDVHLSMRDMGWWTGNPLLAAAQEKVANPTFLSLLRSRCPILIKNEDISVELWEELCALTPYIGVSHQTFRFPDGNSAYWNDAGATAIRHRESTDDPYPMRDSYDNRNNSIAEEKFERLRAAYGMNDGDWYVCLHMRDTATRNEVAGVGESIRATDMQNYIDAIQYITRQGGWVVRMGGAKVAPLPKMERVIDYARSDFRSHELDIHLVRHCSYFIGTTSGFAYVANSFGKPSAMVNAISSLGLLWTSSTRFVFKPITTESRRFLNQNELISDDYRWAYPTYESMRKAGLDARENTSDEILEAVKEVDFISRFAINANIGARQMDWILTTSNPSFYGTSLPSEFFLEKYAGKIFVN